MRVVSRKRLFNFGRQHPETQGALNAWYRIVKRSTFKTFVALREAFPSADQVGKLTVFNVGGNKVRLIVAIHYNTQRVYVRHVFTHAEYDRKKMEGVIL